MLRYLFFLIKYNNYNLTLSDYMMRNITFMVINYTRTICACNVLRYIVGN